MKKEIFESEFLARCRSKLMGLSKEDCPLSDEEFAAYKEGWMAAWHQAMDILPKMMRETKDITEGGVRYEGDGKGFVRDVRRENGGGVSETESCVCPERSDIKGAVGGPAGETDKELQRSNS